MHQKGKDETLNKRVFNPTLKREEAVFGKQLDLNQLIVQLRSTPNLMRLQGKPEASLVPIT